MALRDISWITEGNFIETKRKVLKERFTLVFGTSVTRIRDRTIKDGEWIALTEAAAQNFVSDSARAADTNQSFEALEDNRYCGAWKVTRHTDSRGPWTVDT